MVRRTLKRALYVASSGPAVRIAKEHELPNREPRTLNPERNMNLNTN
jgi:hypothetical protein